MRYEAEDDELGVLSMDGATFLRTVIPPQRFIHQAGILPGTDYVYYSDFFVPPNFEHFGFCHDQCFITEAPGESSVIMCRFKDGEVRRLIDSCRVNPSYNYVIVQTLIGDDGFLTRADCEALPPNVLKVFSKNVKYVHPRVVPMPIGRDWRVIRDDCTKVFEREKYSTYSNLAYMNFSVETNPEIRGEVAERFGAEPWVTAKMPERYGQYALDHCEFIGELHRHTFTFSPQGRAIDCYRTWDALFAKSIPIVDNSLHIGEFADLPLIIVDDWAKLSEPYLRDEFARIQETTFNLAPCLNSYWKYRFRKSLLGDRY